MTSRIGGVVFDLDGTLVDSRADIATAANFALKRHGRPPLGEAAIAGFVGDGARLLIARAAELPLGSGELTPIVDTFIEYYTAHACVATKLMPGARQALDTLSGWPLALLTNKSRPVTVALLAALGLSERFDCVIAGDDYPTIKPDPWLLVEVGRRIGVPPARLVMVGDGPQDVQCGRGAGALTIAVLGGIANADRLREAQPDYCISSLAELNGLLCNLE